MRFIHTEELNSLSADGTGPWRIEEGRLLRAEWSRKPIKTEAQARELFEVYAAAYKSGAGTPAPYEVVQVPTGFGVVVEYVQGVPLTAHIILGIYTPEEAGEALAQVAKRLHATRMHLGRDFREAYLRSAREYMAQDADEEAEEFLALVESIPGSSCLLHGDLHPANILVLNEKLSVIDVETAGYGHPLFDLAASRRNIIYSTKAMDALGIQNEQELTKVKNRLWGSILENYFEGTNKDELANIDSQLELLGKYKPLPYRGR